MNKYGVDIKWLAVTSFEMKFGDITVVSDPCITDSEGTELDYKAVEKCDIITVSHGHWDHITDIPALVEKFNPKVLCGQMTAMPLAKWLNYKATKIYPMNYGLELDFGEVKALFGRHKIQALGYNDVTAKIEKSPHCADEGIKELQGIGSLEYINYLFTAKNGTKVLIWGNDPTIEQINICKELKPDIAILQRGKGVEQCAQIAKLVKEMGCKVVIPHHHDFHQIDPPEIIECFKGEIAKVAPDVEFINPKHGEWISL